MPISFITIELIRKPVSRDEDLERRFRLERLPSALRPSSNATSFITILYLSHPYTAHSFPTTCINALPLNLLHTSQEWHN